MEIPVILSVPRSETFAYSALKQLPLGTLGVQKNILGSKVCKVDTDAASVPLAYTERKKILGSRLDISAAERFGVRGTLNIDGLDSIPKEINGARVYSDPTVESCTICVDDPSIGQFTDIRPRFGLDDTKYNAFNGDGVAIAIVDGGINKDHLIDKLGFEPNTDFSNSYRPIDEVNEPFMHPVGHGTMCAFNALVVSPKATLLDVPFLGQGHSGATVIGSALSSAMLAYAHLISLWGVAFADNGFDKYKALIVNNSWALYNTSQDFEAGHPGRYSDNPEHPFNTMVMMLSSIGADVVFAAGNCGEDCPLSRCKGDTTETIVGANALAQVLTIAGCDLNEERVGYSSLGPAVTGMAHKKPDIAAFTHFIGSQHLGSAKPDVGTSTSAPIVSGCLAAIRTIAKRKDWTPADIKKILLSTAKNEDSKWEPKLGHGVIEPRMAIEAMELV